MRAVVFIDQVLNLILNSANHEYDLTNPYLLFDLYSVDTQFRFTQKPSGGISVLNTFDITDGMDSNIAQLNEKANTLKNNTSMIDRLDIHPSNVQPNYLNSYTMFK